MHLGTSALLVRDMPLGRLKAALPDRYYETDDPIDARMAFSPALGPDTAVTSVGAWTVLCDPRGELTRSAEWLRRLSVGRKAFALVRHDADGLHGFSSLEDGTMRRRRAGWRRGRSRRSACGSVYSADPAPLEDLLDLTELVVAGGLRSCRSLAAGQRRRARQLVRARLATARDGPAP